MAPRFLNIHYPELMLHPNKIDELPTIDCKPAEEIFISLGLKEVDLWVLDVEGAEEMVLKGMDFKSIRINFICMECDGDHMYDKER